MGSSYWNACVCDFNYLNKLPIWEFVLSVGGQKHWPLYCFMLSLITYRYNYNNTCNLIILNGYNNTQNIYSIVFSIVSAIKFLIIKVLLFALNIIHDMGVDCRTLRCDAKMSRESSTEPIPHLHFGWNC